MNEPRDTFVGDALRRLDVPDHGPDFWARLDTELAAGPPTAGDATDEGDVGGHDAEVVELGASRARRRSAPGRSGRRPAVAAAVAAAAAIALAVGLPAAQQAADGDAQVDMADVPDGADPDAVQPAPDTTPTTPPIETTTTTAPDPAVTLLAAEELAGEWLTHLRAGEVDAAYAMLDTPSQDRLSRDGFEQVSTGLAEGAGAFSGPEVTSRTAVIERPGERSATVVTFVGDVEREGMVETAGYAVVVTGDSPDVLGIAFVNAGPSVALDTLSASDETRTSPLGVTTSEAAEVWVTVDGSAPENRTGGSVVIDVEAIAGAGTHVVTIVAVEDGLFTAVSTTVVVP